MPADVPPHPHERARAGVHRWSLIPAPPLDVWEWVTTPEGINQELWPVLRMTVPARLRGVSIDQLTPGDFVGRSWFLLGGVVPVDFDDITLEVIESPRYFREHSTMLTFTDWVHARWVRPAGEHISVVEDRVSWIGRGPLNRTALMQAVQRRMLGAMFAHRHRRLAEHFADTKRAKATFVEDVDRGWSGLAEEAS